MTEIHLQADERIDYLAGTALKLIQSREVFSFGIDAVLLAAFPRIPKQGRIVDLCAGNGAVGLLASPYTQAEIIEIELQARLADMATRSIRLNQLTEQMRVIKDDLKNSPKQLAASSVDLIYCNPPYFPAGSASNVSENSYQRLARHEVSAKLTDVVSVSQQLLKPGGHLALVHRPERFFEIIDSLRAAKLQPKRIQFVHPKSNAPANILLIDAIKDGRRGGEIFLPPLVVYDEEGNYTAEVKEIYAFKK